MKQYLFYMEESYIEPSCGRTRYKIAHVESLEELKNIIKTADCKTFEDWHLFDPILMYPNTTYNNCFTVDKDSRTMCFRIEEECTGEAHIYKDNKNLATIPLGSNIGRCARFLPAFDAVMTVDDKMSRVQTYNFYSYDGVHLGKIVSQVNVYQLRNVIK